MANFFDETRIECECGGLLFEEVQTFMLNKDEVTGISTKVPYKKVYRCMSCGKTHSFKVKE